MTTALIFPGQGAQTPGFLHRLWDHPAVAETLATASRVLGRDVLSLDTEAALASTVAVQLTALIAGTAVARALKACGVVPEAVAGLSVGAFTAAVAAGAIAFEDALPLVELRCHLMETAYPHGYGMAAFVGLGQGRVERLVAELAGPGRPLYLANLNAPTQFVLAGSDEALAAAIEAAREIGARKAERMTVSVPSHCPLLDGVAAELAQAVAKVPFKRPDVLFIDSRGRPARTAEAVAADLAGNVARPIRWHDAATHLYERGVRLFIEAPPGTVLTGLVSESFPEAKARCSAGNSPAFLARLDREERERPA